MLKKLISLFAEEKMQTQCNLLGYKNDLCFQDYKLEIEMKMVMKYEIKRQEAMEREIGCEFIRIHLDKEHYDIFNAINEILKYIKQSSNQLAKKH